MLDPVEYQLSIFWSVLEFGVVGYLFNHLLFIIIFVVEVLKILLNDCSMFFIDNVRGLIYLLCLNK